MIWTFTPNPALDITWQAPDQTRGQVHRITEYSQRPGGKGLNVSRVLEQLGVPNHATGFLGGTTGQAIASLMEEMTTQVTTHWVDVPVQTRRSIAMIDGEATVYNESGFSLPPHAWEARRMFWLFPDPFLGTQVLSLLSQFLSLPASADAGSSWTPLGRLWFSAHAGLMF